MKPKTNREKVEYIRAFDKEFNVKRSKDLDFLLMLARYTNGPELTPEAWQQLDDLYHHVLSLEEGNQDQEKGREDEPGTRHPRFIERIDWDMLRDQKKMLVTMDTYHELSQAEEDALTGIIHLIDAIQDYAADTMGLSNRKVFDLPG